MQMTSALITAPKGRLGQEKPTLRCSVGNHSASDPETSFIVRRKQINININNLLNRHKEIHWWVFWKVRLLSVHLECSFICIFIYLHLVAGSQCEESRPWQGHEEGSWQTQGVLRLQGPLWKFLSMYPNKNLPVFVLCFSTLLTFSGKSQFRALVFCIWKSVSIQKTPLMAFWPACRTRTAARVIVWGLLTTGGTGSLKHPRNVRVSEESKSLE